MVLQQWPAQAIVWGFGSGAGPDVTVRMGTATVTGTVSATGVWQVRLPPTKGSMTAVHNITAVQGGTQATLTGVLFGDVWVCAGQSNMGYAVGSIDDAAAEVARMADYSAIRLLQMFPTHQSAPLLEASNSGWRTAPQYTKLPTANFSAVCWLFGRNLQAALEPPRPIGLIEASLGSTSIEAWSSADAQAACTLARTDGSGLWNGLIEPLLSSVVKGVIWYQGEQDWRDPRLYRCQQAALVRDWRSKWLERTNGSTNASFPFGWVQLNSIGIPPRELYTTNYSSPNMWKRWDNTGAYARGFTGIRWAQKNALQDVGGTFMAVSLDAPAIDGGVHSPFKQPVGLRMARGALVSAYGVANIMTQPTATVDRLGSRVLVTVHSGVGDDGRVPIEVRSSLGFEALAPDNNWHWTPIVASDLAAGTVTLGRVPAGATAVRYLWEDAPCTLQPFQCPIYTVVPALAPLSAEPDALPLGPFVANLTLTADDTPDRRMPARGDTDKAADVDISAPHK